MQDNSPAITLRGPIAGDIQEHLHKPFGSLPAAIAARIEKAFSGILVDSQLDLLTHDERIQRDADRGHSEIALRWNESTPEQRSLTAIASDESAALQARYAEHRTRMKSREYIAGWWDESMHASSWWRNESITPIYAALILSGHNPNKGSDANMIEAAEKTTSEGIGPDEFRALKNKFEGANKDKPRTLKEWMEYAQQHGEKIHSWVGEWLQAGGAPLPVSTTQTAPASGSLNHDAPLNMKALKGGRMKILSHKHLHGRDFGSSLFGVTEFSEWLSNNRLRIETNPNIREYDFVQVEALLCAVECAAFGSVADDEAKEIVAADQIMVAENMASDAPLWLVGAEAHRKWREVITRAVMSGSLQLLDFGSKLPTSIPTAAKIEGEARGWVDAKTDIAAAPASEPVPPVAALPSIGGAIIRRKLRSNSLDVAIIKAIHQAASLDTGAVYLRLREIALSGEVPFSGVVEGDALHYTNDKNTPAKLSKPMLGKRLKNHTL